MQSKQAILFALLVLAVGVGMAFTLPKPEPVEIEEPQKTSPGLANVKLTSSVEPKKEYVAPLPKAKTEPAQKLPTRAVSVFQSQPSDSKTPTEIERGKPLAPPKMELSFKETKELQKQPLPSIRKPQKDDRRYHWHRIRDGDTLVRLAEYYLNNPRRAADIRRLNYEVLGKSTLLRIGTLVRIPRE